MRLGAKITGSAALEARLGRIARMDGLRRVVEHAAGEVRAGALAELGEDAAIAGTLEVRPRPDGPGATVATSSDAAWQREFGSRTTPARPWFFSALAAALPRINQDFGNLVRLWVAGGQGNSA